MVRILSLVPVVGLVALAVLPRAFAASQDSASDTPTLSVSTRLVQVDVIVRDDSGPVEGLSAAEAGYLRVVVRSAGNQAAGSLWIPLN